ncbi:MAG: metal-sensitive transcriptional regulator [Chloroflexota bacterium]|nr:metal-sensitive transcriptional regulator [Chloroflexota bacterium]
MEPRHRKSASAASETRTSPAPQAPGSQGRPGHFRHSYTKDRTQLLRRLSRIEGQVRGIGRMIERDEYCVDILQQTAALRAAVDSVALLIMEDHVAGCLKTAVQTGDAGAYTEEVMDVVRRTLGRPVRSRQASD